MARRRGLSNSERFATDFISVTSTGTLISAPCFIYAVDFAVTDSSVSANFSLSDTTASADGSKETTRMDFKYGATVASGASDVHANTVFNVPVNVQNQLCWINSTNVRSVTVQFISQS